MAADMTQLEFALTPLCSRFEELGIVYKQYRAFRFVDLTIFLKILLRNSNHYFYKKLVYKKHIPVITRRCSDVATTGIFMNIA